MRVLSVRSFALAVLSMVAIADAHAGSDASWRGDRPGAHHRIDAVSLPAPYATRSSSNGPAEAAVPAGALPKVPTGFAVTRFATGLEGPRAIRVAPNGDVFVAETAAGRIRVLRTAPGSTTAAAITVYASELDEPFGMAFAPPGPEPRWLYVAETNRVLRFPYRPGEATAIGRPETVVPRLARSTGGHTTRDLRFSPDGRRMLVSVGSASNFAQEIARQPPKGFVESHSLGAAWGEEIDRADVLSFTPEGGDRQVVATGLRNCVGLALQPGTGALWCAVNERDGLGDDLVPDYVTHVAPGAFYGWPWLYLGSREDPRLAGARPDLTFKSTLPDVLIQSHSAPLQLAFYDPAPGGPAAFPRDYDGDAFVTLHGSWNRALRTGYKVVRIRLKDGVPVGGYDDFLTGFVQSDDAVWGRPVGLAVAQDGALLVGEDANGTIYRVAPLAERAAR